MTNRTLAKLAAWPVPFLILLAHVAATQHERGGTTGAVALLTVAGALAAVSLVAGAGLLGRAEAAEHDADRWRASWGADVGPCRAALARLTHLAERALGRETPREVGGEGPNAGSSLIARAQALESALAQVRPWALVIEAQRWHTAQEAEALRAGADWALPRVRSGWTVTPDRAAEAAELWCVAEGRWDCAEAGLRPAALFALAAVAIAGQHGHLGPSTKPDAPCSRLMGAKPKVCDENRG